MAPQHSRALRAYKPAVPLFSVYSTGYSRNARGATLAQQSLARENSVRFPVHCPLLSLASSAGFRNKIHGGLHTHAVLSTRARPTHATNTLSTHLREVLHIQRLGDTSFGHISPPGTAKL